MKVNGRVLPSALELRHNAEFGYHIAATRAMEAGTVLSQEAPLATCPATDDLAALCRRCLDPIPLRHTTPHHVCPRCTIVHYCSRYCRRADRDDHHYSGECVLLAAPNTRRDARRLCTAAACMAAALQATHDGTFRAPTPPSSPSSSSDDEAQQAAPMDAQQQAAATNEEQPRQHAQRVVHTVTRHGRSLDALRTAAVGALATVVANALELHPLLVQGEASGGQAPAAVYRLGSRCNHSCRPNMTWSFKQKTHLVLRTLRDVAPGEQLTIAYVDVVAPAAQRAAALRQQYAFECVCSRCSAEKPADWRLSGCLFRGEWHYQSSRQTWHCVGGGRDDATASGRDNATASVCAQRAACVQGAVAAAAALLIDTGDAAGCAAAMLTALHDACRASMPLHPMHSLVLEAATCLASACTVQGMQGGRKEALWAAGWTLVGAAPSRHLLLTHDAAACCYRLQCMDASLNEESDCAEEEELIPCKRPRRSLQRLEQVVLAAATGDWSLAPPPTTATLESDDDLLCMLLQACYADAGEAGDGMPNSLPASGPWLRAACRLHGMAAACARAAVGDAHPLADRIAFLPFFVGVPVPQASAITQIMPGMMDDAMRTVVRACNRV